MAVIQGPSGRFDFKRSGGGSILSATFEVQQMITRAQRARGEAKKLDKAAREANLQLARELQRHIEAALQAKIEERGREQRSKSGRLSLGQAILSPENRSVNTRGYSVGYLNKIPDVARFFEGLEVGTDRHVGRFLKGVFRDAAGNASVRYGQKTTRGGYRPRYPILIENGRDATFFQEAPWRKTPFMLNWAGVKIKHAIKPYHYFRDGEKAFLAAGGATTLAREFYSEHFEAAGIELLRLDRANLPRRI